MPGVKGGHVKKARDQIKKRIVEVIRKEPHLSNRTLATRFNVSIYMIEQVRKKMGEKAPDSEFVTMKEHRACKAGKFKLSYKQRHWRPKYKKNDDKNEEN